MTFSKVVIVKPTGRHKERKKERKCHRDRNKTENASSLTLLQLLKIKFQLATQMMVIPKKDPATHRALQCVPHFAGPI